MRRERNGSNDNLHRTGKRRRRIGKGSGMRSGNAGSRIIVGGNRTGSNSGMDLKQQHLRRQSPQLQKKCQRCQSRCMALSVSWFPPPSGRLQHRLSPDTPPSTSHRRHRCRIHPRALLRRISSSTSSKPRKASSSKQQCQCSSSSKPCKASSSSKPCKASSSKRQCQCSSSSNNKMP